MTGVTREELAAHFPRLYHMAWHGSWPLIREHGLLSTGALMDLFQVPAEDRAKIEGSHRAEARELARIGVGRAVVRDQKPMSDGALRKCLQDGLAPEDWYRMLNGRVFFWLSEERLEELLRARAYRDRRHTVLTVETAALLESHGDRVELSPINSGSTVYNPQPRGRDTFLAPDRYPFDQWRRRRGAAKRAAAELTVLGSVSPIEPVTLRVEDRGAGAASVLIWERDF